MIRGLASLLVFGGFSYGTYSFAFAVTRYLLERTHTGLYLFHTFISMMLFVFFIAVNLGNIIVSYSTLYRSSEVGFLITKPIPFTSIFILKFFDNFFYSSTTLFLGAFMMLLGYGTYFGFPWYYYILVMLFVLIPFMFLSACLALLILMMIMKIAGRIGFRNVLVGIFFIYFLMIYFFFDASNPVTLVEKINRFYPNVDAYLQQSIPGFLQYLPNQWIAEFLYNIARGDLVASIPYAGLLLLTVAVAFTACLIVAQRFYYRSWLISLQIKSAAQKYFDISRRRIVDFRRGSIFSSKTDVLLKKEILTFFREPSQWIHLLVMVILIGLFSLSVRKINLQLHIKDMQLVTYLVLYAFSGFMISSLSLRFVFPSIGLEGEAFWSLRSSPIKIGKIFFIKFFMSFCIVFILAEIIAISGNLPFLKLVAMRPLLLWFGMYSAFWISVTTVSINLGLGGYFANFSEHNPIRAASTQGATLTFLLTIFYLILMIALVFLPISSYFGMLFGYQYFPIKLIVVPGTLFAVVSYLLSIVGIIIGIRSLRRDF